MTSIDREKLKKYIKVAPRIKLLWLEEMLRLSFKSSTKPLQIYKSIKSSN